MNQLIVKHALRMCRVRRAYHGAHSAPADIAMKNTLALSARVRTPATLIEKNQ